MATAANAAAKVPVVLESPVGAVLLRFDQHRDGSLQPVWEDPDATPSRCVERLFLEESAAKRRRHEGAGPVESDRERIEFLREAQETALDGVQRATTAAQLLSVGATEGETQFLALQSAVPRPLDFSQIMRHASEVDEAAEAHRQELLDIANARLTNKALQQFKEMEAALSFLGQRWHLHCVAGQYAIELRLGRIFCNMCCALGLRVITISGRTHAERWRGRSTISHLAEWRILWPCLDLRGRHLRRTRPQRDFGFSSKTRTAECVSAGSSHNFCIWIVRTCKDRVFWQTTQTPNSSSPTEIFKKALKP